MAFTDLPNETLFNIIEFLNDKDVCSFFSVNKTIHEFGERVHVERVRSFVKRLSNKVPSNVDVGRVIRARQDYDLNENPKLDVALFHVRFQEENEFREKTIKIDMMLCEEIQSITIYIDQVQFIKDDMSELSDRLFYWSKIQQDLGGCYTLIENVLRRRLQEEALFLNSSLHAMVPVIMKLSNLLHRGYMRLNTLTSKNQL